MLCAGGPAPSCIADTLLCAPLEAGFLERHALLCPGARVHCPSYTCLPICACELWFQGF